MNYGRKTPSSTHKSTGSVYSQGMSSTNLASQRSKSMRSVAVPWYRKPILENNKYFNIQRSAMLAAIASIAIAMFTIATGIFDVYCLVMAAPGSTHYGYFIISYEFVYVGNRHIRNLLMVFSLFSVLGGFIVLAVSIYLVIALRKEYEKRIVPWLWCFAVFTLIRSLGLIFFAIVNDLIFAYNVLTIVIWTLLIVLCIYCWIVVYSLYLVLSDLTKLEDLAHLRMGTLASVQGSVNPSIAGGSVPTTPKTTTTASMK